MMMNEKLVSVLKRIPATLWVCLLVMLTEVALLLFSLIISMFFDPEDNIVFSVGLILLFTWLVSGLFLFVRLLQRFNISRIATATLFMLQVFLLFELCRMVGAWGGYASKENILYGLFIGISVLTSLLFFSGGIKQYMADH